MASHNDDPVWYASYGSNCEAARFTAYLTGDHADGATRPERGSRDPRPPTQSAPVWFPFGVRFLGNSKKWGGGGVAFLDHGRTRTAPGRRYLITRGQFEDVLAQENRRPVESIPIDSLPTHDVTVVGSGPYDGLVALPPIDGIPVITFTSPRPLDDRPVSAPSAAYVGTILRGLVEIHETPRSELIANLLAAPGVSPTWTAAELEGLVRN